MRPACVAPLGMGQTPARQPVRPWGRREPQLCDKRQPSYRSAADRHRAHSAHYSPSLHPRPQSHRSPSRSAADLDEWWLLRGARVFAIPRAGNSANTRFCTCDGRSAWPARVVTAGSRHRRAGCRSSPHLGQKAPVCEATPSRTPLLPTPAGTVGTYAILHASAPHAGRKHARCGELRLRCRLDQPLDGGPTQMGRSGVVGGAVPLPITPSNRSCMLPGRPSCRIVAAALGVPVELGNAHLLVGRSY